MKLYPLFLFTLLIITKTTFPQIVAANFLCGKHWYCEMTKDADGTIHPVEKSAEGNYMYFLCDSTFELSENGIVLKGQWMFNDTARIITLSQTQMNTIPEIIEFHILDYDSDRLVIIGERGTDNEKTAHLYTK